MRPRPVATLLAVALALLLPATLPAQTASRPPPAQPGQRYLFDTRFMAAPCPEWTVTAVGEGGGYQSECERWRALATADHNVIGVLRPDGSRLWGFDPYFPVLDFPLRVGKQWSGRYEGFNGNLGVGWSSEITCVVEAYEDGEHPQFRIRCDDSFQTLLIVAGTHTSTFWYSPELGRITRQVHGALPENSWRMTGW